MDFDAMAYPDMFEINRTSYKGRRDRKKSEVSIPYTDAPSVEIGDVVIQRNGPNLIELRVTDVDYLENSSLEIGTNHPHILTLDVENMTSAPHKTPRSQPSIQIGSVSGHQVQVGSHNTQTVNISLAEVVRQVAAADDPNAKGLMQQLLENNTVAAIVGAGATALIGVLGA